MASKKHCIILSRVSTYLQQTEAQNLDLVNYAKTKGYTKFKIIETKETAFADYQDKIGMHQMFQFIEENPSYNTVFVTEISRLGRTVLVLSTLRAELEKKKIQLFIKDVNMELFKDGKIDGYTSMAFYLYGMFAESEMKSKLERFQREKRRLMENKLSFGSKPLFGYKIEEVKGGKNKIVKHPENHKLVQEIFNWYAYGFEEYDNPSIVFLSRKCIEKNKHDYTHSKRNLNKLLKEEGYTGEKITNNKRINPKHKINPNEPKYIETSNLIRYEPIIDQDLFDLVQNKLSNNRYKADRYSKHTTILAKLIRCSSCNRFLGGEYRTRDGRPKNSYRCTGRSDSKKCENSQSFSMSLIDSAVWSLIKHDIKKLCTRINEISPNLEYLEYLKRRDNLKEKLSTINDEIHKILSDKERRVSRYKNIDHSNLELTENKRLDVLDKEITTFERSLLKIESYLTLLENKQEDIEEILKSNINEIENSKDLLKKYVNSFIEDIVIEEHNRKHTLIKVNFISYSTQRYNIPFNHIELEGNTESTQLLIDKRVTQSPKIYKCVSNLIGESIPYHQLLNSLDKDTEYSYIYPIGYTKLQV